MKKIAIVLIFISSAHFTFCQKTRIGFLIGTNNSVLNGEIEEFTREFGYNLGIVTSRELTEKMGVQLRTLYNKKRTNRELKSRGLIPPVTSITRFDYRYLTNSVLVDYEPIGFLKITGGISLDILLSDKIEVDSTAPFADSTNNFDFGINIGPTLIYSDFEISILYNKNFQKVSETFDEQTFNTISLNLGYYFL